MRPTALPTLLAVSLVAVAAACGGGGEKAATPKPATPAVTPGSPLTPGPGGVVITIELTTDDQGVNKFTPSEFTAHPGDVMRYTLGTGVHNVDFLPDSNRTLTSPPPASPLLQVPGQTYDIAVDFPPGRYYFQCDPHALLGMIGHVTVEAKTP